jgi:hypothetical protein
MADTVTRKPAKFFHHEGKLVGPDSPPITMSRQRAAALDASRLLVPEKASGGAGDGKRPPGLSVLQHEGRPNDEPPADTSLGPVSPAPGAGVPERARLAAEPPVDPGTTNPEPKPDTSLGPVSPAPGSGLPEGRVVAEDPADRAAMKVRENKAPDDPAASPGDNYAVPLGAVTSEPGGGVGVRAAPGPASAAREATKAPAPKAAAPKVRGGRRPRA